MRLLFTGGGGAGSEPLYRLLSDRYECHFCDANPEAKPPSIPADRWHVVPNAKDYDFIDELAPLCTSLGVDVLIPGVDEELLRIILGRHFFACEVLLPDDEFVATHLDKLRSMRVLADAGIPVPVTWRRAIVKPREGRGSRGLKRIGHYDGMIVQEQLDGPEYTVTMVANKQKRLRAVVPVRVLEKRGITLRAETDFDADIIAACERIHNVDTTSGVYNIQGILTADGFKPFEINPRVSTTTCLAIAAGVDVIGLALDTQHGQSRSQFGKVTLRRSWQTEIA